VYFVAHIRQNTGVLKARKRNEDPKTPFIRRLNCLSPPLNGLASPYKAYREKKDEEREGR
jgi:hypothetical protein